MSHSFHISGKGVMNMSGILLIATFVFLFVFGYHMMGHLDQFLDTNNFYPPQDASEKVISTGEISAQEVSSLHQNEVNRAS